MKYKKAFLKAIAVITAFSVAFVSEGAGFITVIAAPSYAAQDSDAISIFNGGGGKI